MKTFALALAVTIIPSAATAQPAVTAGIVAFAVAQAADGVTTWQALQRPGTYEANPVMRWVAHSKWSLVATKAVTTAALSWAMHDVAKRHPRWAAVVLWIASGAVSYVAYRNHRAGRETP